VTEILQVFSKDIEFLWPQVEPLVIAALRGVPTHDADDVKAHLQHGGVQLIIQWNGTVEAIAVVSVVAFPKGRWLNVWLSAAHPETPLASEQFWAFIDEYRRRTECRGIQASAARIGWLKRVPSLKLEGYSLRSCD
jgi:hypothetical protein